MSETCACGKREVPATGGCGCGGRGHGGHGGGGCGCGGGGGRGVKVDSTIQDRSEGRPQLGLRSGI